jgi:hypothetical protein
VSPRLVRNRSRTNDLLLLALGATVGVVAGALLIDRVGGVDRLLARSRRGRLAPAAPEPDSEPAEAPYGLHDADGGYDGADEADGAEAAEFADETDADETDEADVAGFADEADVAGFGDEADTTDGGVGGARDDAVAAPDLLTLEARVLEAFHHDPVLRERAIDIGAIAPGVIELTGWVYGADEIRHALTLARGVPAVAHVVNQLAVRQPPRQRRATDRPGPGDRASDAAPSPGAD